jgi:hypothetical protein
MRSPKRRPWSRLRSLTRRIDRSTSVPPCRRRLGFGAGAKPAFNGDVCTIVSAKQVTSISGVSAKCTAAKPSKGPGSTIYVGNWAGLTPKSPTVQVTVASYTDPGAAYEAKGASSVGIHVAVGKYIAYLSLNGVGTPPKSPTVLEPLAKAVAARL